MPASPHAGQSATTLPLLVLAEGVLLLWLLERIDQLPQNPLRRRQVPARAHRHTL